ncbi:Haem-binding domain-containing protein [Lutibacter agarilyticus]|uniref:Haem-binding domain-containing protein n=1 Tax=Lutibacter agarilyticus TaxID=1109740 RepID=A0A238YXG4_9FLAO|nr:heme-binding domain-containing protein [Lutibacter agarilyticus]SNR75313.1 Haem-binding domain-containing protein [Lutibacter agarilyticus]
MKKVLLSIVVVFILIQLIRPHKNDSKNNINHISTVIDVPDEVEQILLNSCNDCHSNSTVYPWYSEIAPVSWYLASHVNDGKAHLNFSEWTAYNKYQKEHILKNFEEVLLSHEMPLKSYLLLHKEAEMSKEQYNALVAWVKTIKEQ